MPFKRRFDVEYNDETRGTTLVHFERLPFDVYKSVRDLRHEICVRSGWRVFRIGAKKEIGSAIYYLYDEDTLEDAVAVDELIVVEKHVSDDKDAEAKHQPDSPIGMRNEISWAPHLRAQQPQDDDPLETITVRDNSTSGRTASLHDGRLHQATTMSPGSVITSNMLPDSSKGQANVTSATLSPSPTPYKSRKFLTGTPPNGAPQSPAVQALQHSEPVMAPIPSPFATTNPSSLWLKVAMSPKRPASSPPSLIGAPGDGPFTPNTPGPRRASSPRDASFLGVGTTTSNDFDISTEQVMSPVQDLYARESYYLPGTEADDPQRGHFMITNLDNLFSTVHHVLSNASTLPRYKAIVYFPLHPASSLAASLFRIMGDVGTVFEARTKWGAAMPPTDPSLPSIDDFMSAERGVLFLNGLVETAIPGTTIIIQAGAPATPTQYNGRLAHVRSSSLTSSLLILAPFEDIFLKKDGITNFPLQYPAFPSSSLSSAMAHSQILTDRALMQISTPLKMKLQANLLAHYKSTGIDVKFGRHAEEIRRFMDRILNDGHTIGPSSEVGLLGVPR